MENFSQDSRSAGVSLNTGPREYEAGVLEWTLWLRYVVANVTYETIDAGWSKNCFSVPCDG
jgi:hypothetical protein